MTIPIVVFADKSFRGKVATIKILAGDTSKLSLRENEKGINTTNKATFYAVIKKDSLTKTADRFTLVVSIAGSMETDTTKIKVIPGHLLGYALNDYLNDDTLNAIGSGGQQISCHDLLNQSISPIHISSENIINEVKYQPLKRSFLRSYIYRLSDFWR